MNSKSKTRVNVLKSDNVGKCANQCGAGSVPAPIEKCLRCIIQHYPEDHPQHKAIQEQMSRVINEKNKATPQKIKK